MDGPFESLISNHIALMFHVEYEHNNVLVVVLFLRIRFQAAQRFFFLLCCHWSCYSTHKNLILHTIRYTTSTSFFLLAVFEQAWHALNIEQMSNKFWIAAWTQTYCNAKLEKL